MSVELDDRPDERVDTPPQKSFLTHALVYGLGAMALQAASMLLVPLYTRCLEPAEFGILEMLNRIGEVFNICLMANGIRLAAFTFYCQAKGDQDRRRTVATIVYLPLLLVVGGGLTATLLAPYLDLLVAIDDSALVIFGILLVTLEGTTAVPLALIQARVESAYYVAITAAMFCFRITLTILAVAWLDWGVWGVLGASAASAATFGGYLSWRELSKTSFRVDFGKLKEVLWFCLPFVPAGFFGMILHNGDRFFLIHYAGAGEVGQYALGYKLVAAIALLTVGPLAQVWTARMYDAFKLPQAPEFVGKVCTRILAAYLFAALGLFILQDEILRILASPSYRGAGAVIGPLALAYFFWHASNLMDAPFWVFRRTGRKSWILSGSAASAIVLCVCLIPSHGVIGAACATMLALMIHCAITFLVSQRLFHVDYEYGRLLAMLASCVFLGFASRYAGHDAAGIASKACLWLAWPLILWSSGVVTAEEKSMVFAGCSRALGWLGRRPLEPSPERTAS